MKETLLNIKNFLIKENIKATILNLHDTIVVSLINFNIYDINYINSLEKQLNTIKSFKKIVIA